LPSESFSSEGARLLIFRFARSAVPRAERPGCLVTASKIVLLSSVRKHVRHGFISSVRAVIQILAGERNPVDVWSHRIKCSIFFSFSCYFCGGFFLTSASCSIKYTSDCELLRLSVFGCRSLTRGFGCVD
jgi:hypothetical protein